MSYYIISRKSLDQAFAVTFVSDNEIEAAMALKNYPNTTRLAQLLPGVKTGWEGLAQARTVAKKMTEYYAS